MPRRDEHSAVHDTSVPEQDWPVDVSPLLRRVYRARGALTHAQAQPRLNQLLNRTRLTREEVDILRGLARAIGKSGG